MAPRIISPEEAAAQVAKMATRIAKMWDEAAAARYLANEKRKLAWLARHGYAEVPRSHGPCWRWLKYGRCTAGRRCNDTVGEHVFAFLDRRDERVLVSAPYPDHFSMNFVSAMCAEHGLRAEVRETDPFYGYGTIHIEFRKAQ